MDRNTMIVLNKALEADKESFVQNVLEPLVRGFKALDARITVLETPRTVRAFRYIRGKIWAWWFLRKKRAQARAAKKSLEQSSPGVVS